MSELRSPEVSHDQLAEKTAEVLSAIRKSSSIVLKTVRTHSFAAIEDMRRNAPTYQRHLQDLRLRLQQSDEFSLRDPTGPQTLNVITERYAQAIDDIWQLPVPAMAICAYLALRFLSAVGSLSDTVFGGVMRRRRLFIVFALAPTLTLGVRYEQRVAKESGIHFTEWTSDVWMMTLQRLPPVFCLLATACCGVASKAVSDIVRGLIELLFAIRFRTFAVAGIMYWVVKLNGAESMARSLQDRLPPPANDALCRASLMLAYGRARMGSFGEKTSPLVEEAACCLRQSLGDVSREGEYDEGNI